MQLLAGLTEAEITRTWHMIESGAAMVEDEVQQLLLCAPQARAMCYGEHALQSFCALRDELSDLLDNDIVFHPPARWHVIVCPVCGSCDEYLRPNPAEFTCGHFLPWSAR